MKIVIVADAKDRYEILSGKLQGELEKLIPCEVIFLPYDKEMRTQLILRLQTIAPDILCTIDLAGFEQCTLTDNISYNLLNCKQIHLLLHEGTDNEMYLHKQLSLAMFFYVNGDDYLSYLKNKYSNLPYLQKITGWQAGIFDECLTDNATVLATIVQQVMKICDLH